MDTSKRTGADQNKIGSNNAREQNAQDNVHRATGDAGGGSDATDGISAGVGGTALPADEINRQRRETPGGDASKHDDNIKTD